MASSESPPSGSDDAKSPSSENAQPTPSAGEATGEQPKEIAPESVFVNNQPIREDQVQNAVKFLSHPKVRGSPVIHRRNFLERKGLTKDEIDEAFRRVPDPSPSATTGQATNTDNQVQPSAPIQQNPAQAIQPVASPASKGFSFLPNQFRWTHAIFVIGFLAASGAGTFVLFKRSIVPRFKSWVRRIASNEDNVDPKEESVKSNLEEQVTAAAKSAASAAADVARTSQEIVFMQSEGNRRMEEFMNLYSSQLQEMKLMRNTIASLEGKRYSAVRNIHVEDEYQGGSFSRVKQPMSNGGGTEYDSRSVRSVSPPVYAEPPYPKSYMETMARAQRGERPPMSRDVDDSPFNPSQPISNPNYGPRSKPWESVQTQNSTSFASQTPSINESHNSMVQDRNTNIYQRLNYQEASPAAWWEQKNPKMTEMGNDPVSSDARPVDQQPLPRRWVPPQPPPVVMPEAAVAIRQPKSTAAPKDANPEMVPPQDNAVDELQRIHQISESGGLEKMNGSGSEISSSEIQEEPVGS